MIVRLCPPRWAILLERGMTAVSVGGFWLFVSVAFILGLQGCAGKSALPPPAPPVVEVLVPVVQPCEPKKVEPSVLPSSLGLVGDIYEDVKRVLADRATLLADREKLVASNTDPCPKVTP